MYFKKTIIFKYFAQVNKLERAQLVVISMGLRWCAVIILELERDSLLICYFVAYKIRLRYHLI